ncbi:MAG: MurR/RpiR family transcriptional regulator [Clostridia bacterium]
MNTGLSERIKNTQYSFSKGQKLIASFILEHYDKVAFMTASKLGKNVGVSESTVVRFATVLGYSGYPELQEAIQEMIRNRLTSVQRLEIIDSTLEYNLLLDRSMQQDLDVIENTKQDINHEEFYKVAEEVSSCDTVYIIGAGSSSAIATFLYHYLNLIFDRVVLLDSSGEAAILAQLIKVKKNDAVIGISFPRYSKKVIKALQFGLDKGACVVAITDNLMSPIAVNSKHVLVTKSETVSFVDSLVAPLSLINALIVTIAINRKDKVVENLNKLEKIWDEYGVYEKIDEDET